MEEAHVLLQQMLLMISWHVADVQQRIDAAEQIYTLKVQQQIDAANDWCWSIVKEISAWDDVVAIWAIWIL